MKEGMINGKREEKKKERMKERQIERKRIIYLKELNISPDTIFEKE